MFVKSPKELDGIERYILEAIRNRVGEMVEDELAKVVDRVSNRVRQEVAGICASVTADVRFERQGLDLVVRLQDRRGAGKGN